MVFGMVLYVPKLHPIQLGTECARTLNGVCAHRMYSRHAECTVHITDVSRPAKSINEGCSVKKLEGKNAPAWQNGEHVLLCLFTTDPLPIGPLQQAVFGSLQVGSL